MNDTLPIPEGPRAAPLRLPAARGHRATFVVLDEAALFDLPAEVHHAAEGERSKARKAPERPRWASITTGHVLCGPCVITCHEAGPNWHLVPPPRSARKWRTAPDGDRTAYCREHEELQRSHDEQVYGKPAGRK